jgi:CheY-like chemotaxis protein
VVLEPDLLRQQRLRHVLRSAGVERVLFAADGPEVLTLMGGELVQLVLVPWDAPGLSGLELLRALRKRGQNRNVPVVILDDGLPQETIVRAIKAGVAGRLPIPPQVTQLREILARISSGKSVPPEDFDLPC